MQRNLMLVGALVLGLTSSTLAQGNSDFYIAVFKEHVPDHGSAARSVASQQGVALEHVYQHVLNGFVFRGSPQAAAALARRAEIAYVEPDQLFYAWGQTTPTGVNRADVEATGIIDGSDDRLDVDIAIIDTGLDSDHPDLRIDPNGIRFYSSIIGRVRSDSNWEDDNGHGTHVGGTAAAIDNGIGVVGVAPGARLTAVKVLDRNGSGYASAIIAGIDWVAARADRFEVANMSLGSSYYQPINDAVEKAVAKGIVFVVAAGNDGKNAANYSPASAPNAITVSALADSDGLPGSDGPSFVYQDGSLYTDDDTLAPFSNFGAVVDICAPGVLILSTVPGGGYDDGYSGTSMAAPHVAGAAALFMAGKTQRPSVTDVTKALKESGWTSGDPEYFSGDTDGIPEPLLNVGGLMGTVTPPPNTPPTANFSYTTSGLTVTFTDTSSDLDGSIVSRSWTFGDGATSTLQNPSHTYAKAGTYTVQLWVTDDDGAIATASKTVTVSTPSTGIELTARGYKVKGVQRVELSWTGGSAPFEIYRNNALLDRATGSSYTDIIGKVGGGTYTYQVKDLTGSESNIATVTF